MSKLKNYIMAAGLAVGLADGSIDAEARTRKIEDIPMGSDLTPDVKRDMISRDMYGVPYSKLNREKRVGVGSAADKATVVIDPKCKGNQLVYNDNHIMWGIQWHRKQKQKPVEVPRPVNTSSVRNNTNVTNVYQDNRVYNSTTNVYQTDKGRLDEHGRRLDEHGRTIDEHGRLITVHAKRLDKQGKEIEGLKDKSTPYVKRSDVSVYGGIFDERKGGQSFSRGYVAGGNALLRKRFASGKLGQLELKAEGLHTSYTENSGDATVFDGKVRAMLGKWRRVNNVAYEVSGGLSASVSAGQDSYGGFKVGFAEGTALAELEARVDSKYVSAAAKAAVGGGAQTIKGDGVNITSPLVRAEGSVTLEGHAGPVEITGEAGVRYDRLTVQGVARDNTTAYGKGCVRAALGKGVGIGVCAEGGMHTGDKGKATYVKAMGNLGVRF